MKKISVVSPVYNEEENLPGLFEGLHSILSKNGFDFEIIVVDDCSTDDSGKILNRIDLPDFHVFNHPYNMGYGSALKSGVKRAKGEIILFFDSDGQYTLKDSVSVLNEILENDADMVVGSRQKYEGPLWRQPGKKLLTMLANYLVDFKIPDLNSGLRAVRKDLFEKYRHLYPKGFSLSTTLTLTLIKDGYVVEFEPIGHEKREGKSSLRLSDGFKAINLVFRMIMLFSPLRVFLPTAFIIFLLGTMSLVGDISRANITDTTVFLYVTSLILFSLGLLADQVAAIRREIGGKDDEK